MTGSSLLLAILLHPSAQATPPSWADATIHGASEAEMKVTDDDADHEGATTGGGAELYRWNLALYEYQP